MKDPVCGAQVDEKSGSTTSSYQGQKYAFCGKECKDKFDQNPERYTRSAQGSEHQSHGSQQQGGGSQHQGGSQQREKVNR